MPLRRNDRYCLVRECWNTLASAPEKKFFSLPTDQQRRLVWLRAIGRDPSTLSPKTHAFVCQDHFNLDEDLENVVRYKYYRKGVAVLKSGVVPHVFDGHDRRTGVVYGGGMAQCAVERCNNTIKTTPHKYFFPVPKFPLEEREKWFNSMGIDLQEWTSYRHRMGLHMLAYCCEDHFDLMDDVRNQTELRRTHGGIISPSLLKSDRYPRLVVEGKDESEHVVLVDSCDITSMALCVERSNEPDPLSEKGSPDVVEIQIILSDDSSDSSQAIPSLATAEPSTEVSCQNKPSNTTSSSNPPKIRILNPLEINRPSTPVIVSDDDDDSAPLPDHPASLLTSTVVQTSFLEKPVAQNTTPEITSRTQKTTLFNLLTSSSLKRCFNPNCSNSTSNLPESDFIELPNAQTARKAWAESFGVSPSRMAELSASQLYCCKLHFDEKMKTIQSAVNSSVKPIQPPPRPRPSTEVPVVTVDNTVTTDTKREVSLSVGTSSTGTSAMADSSTVDFLVKTEPSDDCPKKEKPPSEGKLPKRVELLNPSEIDRDSSAPKNPPRAPKALPVPPNCNHSGEDEQCQSIGLMDLTSFFTEFYALKTLEEQDAFVFKHMDRETRGSDEALLFFMRKKDIGGLIPVCYSTFCRALAIDATVLLPKATRYFDQRDKENRQNLAPPVCPSSPDPSSQPENGAVEFEPGDYPVIRVLPVAEGIVTTSTGARIDLKNAQNLPYKLVRTEPAVNDVGTTQSEEPVTQEVVPVVSEVTTGDTRPPTSSNDVAVAKPSSSKTMNDSLAEQIQNTMKDLIQPKVNLGSKVAPPKPPKLITSSEPWARKEVSQCWWSFDLCHKCLAVFRSDDEYGSHRRQGCKRARLTRSDFPINCGVCSKVEAHSITEMKHHVQNCHKYVCSFCKASYPELEGIESHLKDSKCKRFVKSNDESSTSPASSPNKINVKNCHVPVQKLKMEEIDELVEKLRSAGENAPATFRAEKSKESQLTELTTISSSVASSDSNESSKSDAIEKSRDCGSGERKRKLGEDNDGASKKSKMSDEAASPSKSKTKNDASCKDGEVNRLIQSDSESDEDIVKTKRTTLSAKRRRISSDLDNEDTILPLNDDENKTKSKGETRQMVSNNAKTKKLIVKDQKAKEDSTAGNEDVNMEKTMRVRKQLSLKELDSDSDDVDDPCAGASSEGSYVPEDADFRESDFSEEDWRSETKCLREAVRGTRSKNRMEKRSRQRKKMTRSRRSVVDSDRGKERKTRRVNECESVQNKKKADKSPVNAKGNVRTTVENKFAEVTDPDVRKKLKAMTEDSVPKEALDRAGMCKCPNCGIEFNSLMLMRNHLKAINSCQLTAEQEALALKIKCLSCKCNFSSNQGLILHLKRSKECIEGIPPVAPAAPAPLLNPNPTTVDKTVPTGTDLIYLCAKCKASFSSVWGLRTHERNTCKPDKTFTVPVTVTREEALRIKREYTASINSKSDPSGSSSSSSDANISSPSGEIKRSFPCELCRKKFATTEKLKEHDCPSSKSEIVSEKCDTCKQNFSSKKLLKDHFDSNDACNPDLKDTYKCPKCSISSKGDLGFLTHFATHSVAKRVPKTANKKYKCFLCTLVFIHVEHMIRHVYWHHPNQHICTICDFQTDSFVLFYDHAQTKHGNP